MKKIIIFLLLIIIGIVGYLKIPTYGSGIEDNFFDTKLMKTNSLSKENGFLLLKDFILKIEENKKNLSAKEIQKMVLKEIKIYSKLKKEKILKFDKNIGFTLKGLVYFEKSKIRYIKSLIKSGGAKKILGIQLLQNSIRNNLFLLKNVEGNMDFFITYQALLVVDLGLLNSFDKNLSFQLKEFKSLFSENKFDKETFYKVIKLEINSFLEKVDNFDSSSNFKLGKENKDEKLESSFSNYLLKIKFFFLFNKTETKELYKYYGKEIIDGNFDKVVLNEGYKNMFGKQNVFLNIKDFKTYYENYNKLIVLIKKIK